MIDFSSFHWQQWFVFLNWTITLLIHLAAQGANPKWRTDTALTLVSFLVILGLSATRWIALISAGFFS